MRKISLFATTFLFCVFYVNAQQKWDRPMELKRCSIDIKADPFTATTFIEIEFCNPNDREIEGLYQFELRPGQVITGFQLDLNGKYRDGSIEEKWKATNAYNSIVGKRIDPALLTMDYADHYSLRIYPVPARGCRKVTMTIQQLLTVDKRDLVYSLPLKVGNTVESFQLNITVSGNAVPATKAGLLADHSFVGSNGKQTLEWNTENIELKSPLSFSFPLSSNAETGVKTINSQTFFALRIQPSSAQEYTLQPKTLTVYWDASASVAKRDINKEINFLKQFISFHNVSQLTIVPFNYKLLDTAIFYTENNFNSRWQQYLQKINYDGSTQLGIIDLTDSRTDLFLLFTDGNNTYGKNKPVKGTAPVSCIHTSNMANHTLLQEIVGAGGGKIIDLNKMSMSSALNIGSKAESWLMHIQSSSGRAITEQLLPLKQEKMLFINGTMPGKTDTLYFHYGNDNRINHIEKIAIEPNEYQNSAIDRVTMLNTFNHILRSYSWSNLIDFGLKEKVVTPNTAYIVLERVEDYVRYNIAPPKELEDECEKMNYVKRDTRFERKKIEEASEYDILSNVLNMYNERIRKWDVNAKPTYIFKHNPDEKTSIAGTTDDKRPVTPANLLNGNAAGIDISSNALEEVVVIGYGTQRKRELIGSVTEIRARDVFSSATSVEQALQGRVPGLQITGSSGMLGSNATVSIRGMSSLNGNNQPLYIVDGIPVSGNINDVVNVHDINDITVLKDQAAAALYGSRAAFGAIVINTKRGKNSFNFYNYKPYRLKDMEDVEYLQELKSASVSEKMSVYERLKEEYGGEVGFYLDAAQHLFEAGLKPHAFNVLMNAAEAANGSLPVLVAMAYILESWGEFQEAIHVYQQLIKANPQHLALYDDLAWAHYQRGNYQEAVDVLFTAIKTNMGYLEQSNLSAKAMLLNDMNAIISMHKDKLDISAIPASIIKSMPVDMRITIGHNKGEMVRASIKEPGGHVTSHPGAATKDGSIVFWNNGAFEYQIKDAIKGKYKISVYYSDYYAYPRRVPSVIRIRKFKNFGRPDQVIQTENVMMDNQNGEIEIGEVKW